MIVLEWSIKQIRSGIIVNNYQSTFCNHLSSSVSNHSSWSLPQMLYIIFRFNFRFTSLIFVNSLQDQWIRYLHFYLITYYSLYMQFMAKALEQCISTYPAISTDLNINQLCYAWCKFFQKHQFYIEINVLYIHWQVTEVGSNVQDILWMMETVMNKTYNGAHLNREPIRR